MYNNREYQYKHVAGAATTVAFVGRGNLGKIDINTATAVGTITIKDSTDGIDGTTIAIIAAATLAGSYLRGYVMSRGLVVVTAGASDITIGYTQG